MKTIFYSMRLGKMIAFTLLCAQITLLGCDMKHNYKLELLSDNYVRGRRISYVFCYDTNTPMIQEAIEEENGDHYTTQPLVFDEATSTLHLCKNRSRFESLASLKLDGQIVSGGDLSITPTEKYDGYFAFLTEAQNATYNLILGKINFNRLEIINKVAFQKGKIIFCEKLSLASEDKKDPEFNNSNLLWFMEEDNQTLLKISLPDLKIKERAALPKKTLFHDISESVARQKIFGYDGEDITYRDFIDKSYEKIVLGNKGNTEQAAFFGSTLKRDPMSDIPRWIYFFDGNKFYVLDYYLHPPGLAYETEVKDFISFLNKGIIVTKDGIFNYRVENRDIILNKIDDQVYLPGLDLNGYLMFNNGKLMYRQNGDIAEFIVYHIEEGVYKGKSDVFTLDAKVIDFDVSFATGNNLITPLIFTDKGVYKLVEVK